jgi:hypothetical protein
MSFTDDLAELGFELVGSDRAGSHRYSMRSNPYLQWWVLVHPDGTAELQWEFELGAYLKAKEFHIAVQDELSLLLFPRTEVRGPADGTWLKGEMERAAAKLDGVDLLRGT